MISKAIKILKSRGLSGLHYIVSSRFRHLLAKQAESFAPLEHDFTGKFGIEIGGPSHVFSRGGVFPLYPIVGHLDNCNFDNSTLWEGHINEGNNFRFDRNKAAGHQYIAEATDMPSQLIGAYDFVLSSHVLEHIANPILALSEWINLLKEQGTLVLLLPDKKETFDHQRPVTTLQHLIEDAQFGTRESDLTHLPEILALHDLARDPEAGTAENFKSRSICNHEHRGLHHHVFDIPLAISLLELMGLSVQASEKLKPHHLLLIAKKK